MRNTRTSRTATQAARPVDPPRVADLRPLSVWAYVWRKLVLVDQAIERRIVRWGRGQ